jgi:DNA-binding beta-propeller fold protein YncE
MRLLAFAAGAATALLIAPSAWAGGRPVALVTAETSNEVLAVSLGSHGGKVLKRVHIADPLMVAAPLHGPAVVVSAKGTVTLLGWHSLRPIRVLRSFRDPQVATIRPGGRYAYVADGGSGEIEVINLRKREVEGAVYVGSQAHHLSFSPDGKRLWVALGETATTIVRLDTKNAIRPHVVGRFHPRYTSHDVKFAPNGRTVWISSATAPSVTVYSAATGKVVKVLSAIEAPQHFAFSGARVLITSGYGSALEERAWRTYTRVGGASLPYGSFNLTALGSQVATTSLFTGQVTELGAGTLGRMWTVKVAPAARYIAISAWPRIRRLRRARVGPR